MLNVTNKPLLSVVMLNIVMQNVVAPTTRVNIVQNTAAQQSAVSVTNGGSLVALVPGVSSSQP